MEEVIIDADAREVSVVGAAVSPVDFLSMTLIPAAKEVAAAFAATEPMDPGEVGRRVEALLVQMRECFPKAEIKLENFHADGMYAREIVIPAGMFAIGEIQKYPHISIISKGEISMLNEHGGITRVKAPCTIVSKPGIRKVGFAHEDTVWTTVHNMAGYSASPPELAAVEDLESFLTCKTREEHNLFLESQKQLEHHK